MALPLAIGLWLTAVAAALALRPLLPVDETRYLAVAWEMWADGEWLVPHLNGQFYGHKPPLLFWLIHLGWAFFGVNEVWPRLIGPLAGLACLLLTRRLGHALWPARRGIGDAALLVLTAFAVWPLFAGMVMFDTLLTAGVLTALLGTVRVAEGRRLAGWSLFAGGLALGFFGKGPAVLPFIVCVPLLGPLWQSGAKHAGPGRTDSATWLSWWWGAALAGLAGLSVIALWALPVVLAEGLDYAAAVLRDQAADRLVEAVDHGRPWWWYAVALPPALLPILAWTRLWRGGQAPLDLGARFCLVWTAGALLLLTLVSGKQVHYLLPVLPAIALFLAWRLADRPAAPRRHDLAMPALLGLVGGVAIALLPQVPLSGERAAEVATLDTGWGWALAAASVAALLAGGGLKRQVTVLAALSTAVLLTIHAVAAPLLAERFDMSPIGERLGTWQREGRPLAHYGTYHGQFHFAGRLRQPVAEIGDAEAAAWMAAHPEGIIVTYQDDVPAGRVPLFVARYRGGLVTVWSVAAALADPAIVRRQRN